MECVVCFEAYVDPRFLDCGHTFCFECIKSLAKGLTVTCPTCRTEETFHNLSELKKNYQLAALLEDLKNNTNANSGINPDSLKVQPNDANSLNQSSRVIDQKPIIQEQPEHRSEIVVPISIERVYNNGNGASTCKDKVKKFCSVFRFSKPNLKKSSCIFLFFLFIFLSFVRNN